MRDMVLEFFTKQFDAAGNTTGSSIAQRAERLPTDIVTNI
jgi:hypothetical protein